MSIIADTLQRLQTPPISERLGTPESPSIVIPIRGKREPGWHNRPSRLKFWFAGLGMAIGLSGLGIAAYWIGFHLDFGLSTYASQRTPQSMALSGSIPNLRSTPFDSPSTESMQMPVASPIQDVPTSASLHPEEEASIIQNSISSATPIPRTTKTLYPQRFQAQFLSLLRLRPDLLTPYPCNCTRHPCQRLLQYRIVRQNWHRPKSVPNQSPH